MFKVGDKVCVPKTKSIESSYEESSLIAFTRWTNPEYLFVVRVTPDRYVIHHENPSSGRTTGDHFLEQDLELYNPEDFYIGGVTDV